MPKQLGSVPVWTLEAEILEEGRREEENEEKAEEETAEKGSKVRESEGPSGKYHGLLAWVVWHRCFAFLTLHN